jgi:hypothetical protein
MMLNAFISKSGIRVNASSEQRSNYLNPPVLVHLRSREGAVEFRKLCSPSRDPVSGSDGTNNPLANGRPQAEHNCSNNHADPRNDNLVFHVWANVAGVVRREAT